MHTLTWQNFHWFIFVFFWQINRKVILINRLKDIIVSEKNMLVNFYRMFMSKYWRPCTKTEWLNLSKIVFKRWFVSEVLIERMTFWINFTDIFWRKFLVLCKKARLFHYRKFLLPENMWVFYLENFVLKLVKINKMSLMKN